MTGREHDLDAQQALEDQQSLDELFALLVKPR